jgi:tRNA 2-thiouridine synthesizing protein A
MTTCPSFVLRKIPGLSVPEIRISTPDYEQSTPDSVPGALLRFTLSTFAENNLMSRVGNSSLRRPSRKRPQLDMPDTRAMEESRTVESLIRDLKQMRDSRCVSCDECLGPHQALQSIAMGFKNSPRCLPCLAAVLKVEPAEFGNSLLEHIRARECFLGAWNWACRETGLPEEAISPSGLESAEDLASTGLSVNGSAVAAFWDAGDMGCGDLVLQLRFRLQSLQPGEIMKLFARDPGAREDLPAWCRLTGHKLLRAEHPAYWIKRKE